MGDKKKTIYIHIGTPKTGTTSIQEYLTRNADRLYQDGYLVPKTSRRHSSNHTLLTNYCINKENITAISVRNGIYTRKKLKNFRKAFYQELRNEILEFPGDSVFISNEQCYGRLFEMEEAGRLKALFEGVSERIVIVVYLREQSDMYSSFYSSQIKNGKTFPIATLEEFQKDVLFDYSEKLKIWEEVFGLDNISLRIFDKTKLIGGDIIVDFCTATGMPIYGNKPERLNAILNVKQCEYLRKVNVYIPFFHNGKVNLLRNGLVDLIANTNIDSPPISDLICSDYQHVHKGSNERVARRYFENQTSLFRNKTLNMKAIDQESILTDEDIAIASNQIISKADEKSETLCKCIAAIFNVEYKNERISQEFVLSLFADNTGEHPETGIGTQLDHIYRRIKARGKRLFKQIV